MLVYDELCVNHAPAVVNCCTMHCAAVANLQWYLSYSPELHSYERVHDAESQQCGAQTFRRRMRNSTFMSQPVKCRRRSLAREGMEKCKSSLLLCSNMLPFI